MLLNDETGKFFLSSVSGSSLALLFEGDKEFIERTYNLAINHNITKGKLFKLWNGMHYVLTTNIKLSKALKQYFFLEKCLTNAKFSYQTDPNDDGNILQANITNEKELQELAEKEAQIFIDQKIIRQKFTIFI